MDLISRSAWGARPYRTPNGAIPYAGRPRGVKVHYLGTRYDDRPHAQCAAYVRGLQAQHMDGNGWSDIGYSFLVCSHGTVYEGRGLRRRNSANGNTALNERHYAVCALLGSSGLTNPPDRQLHGLRDAIDHCRAAGGAGDEIAGHRDGYATACPGDRLYAWVRGGAPRPKTIAPAVPAPVQEEASVAITRADAVMIAERVWLQDGIIRNPGPTKETNTHIAGATSVRNIEIIVRRIERTLAAQDAVIAQLVAALADRDEVDPDALVARITEALERVTITLNTSED